MQYVAVRYKHCSAPSQCLWLNREKNVGKIKYIHSSNTSTKHPLGYMFWPNRAIIRPHIWTGSFDYSTFWDPKLFTKVISQCCVLNDILRLKQMLKRQMSIKKIMLVKNSSVRIITLMCLHLLLKCHTLTTCYILFMLAFLWRLFTSGWGEFTLLRFVVFINVFGLHLVYSIVIPSL
jgi:hypothetical protein